MTLRLVAAAALLIRFLLSPAPSWLNRMTVWSVTSLIGDRGSADKEVAMKYANDQRAPAMLFAKVKDGGRGVWGDVPMPPNPQVNDADLKKIIAWVLSLK